jgi:hypothetical protein
MKFSKMQMILASMLILMFFIGYFYINRYEIENLNSKESLILNKITGEIYVIDTKKKQKVNYFEIEKQIMIEEKILGKLKEYSDKMDQKTSEIKKYRDESETILREIYAIKEELLKVKQ